MNSGRDQLARLALQQAVQKQQATGRIGDVFAHVLDQNQDYAQDAPDYATPQPRPGLSLADPAQFSRDAITMGDPGMLGKVLQLAGGLQGGVADPSVGVGSLPSGGYAQTPEGITNANQLAIQKSAADAQSSAAQKPFTAIGPDGTPVTTNDAAAAAGHLPAGAVPMVSTDQQKAYELGNRVFHPAAGAAPMTDDQQQVLGVDKAAPRPLTPEERTSFSIPANAPAFMNEKGAPQTLNDHSTTVNVDTAGQRKFAQTLDEQRAQTVSGKMKAGEAAAPVIEGTNEAIGALNRMIKNGGTTGVGAQGMTKVKSAANVAFNALGLPPLAGDLSDPNVFTKATNGIAMNSLKQLVQGAGGRITNMEVQQFQQMNPGWDLSPEGNMRMLQLINQAAVRDQGLANVLKSVKSNDPADFDAAEQAYLAGRHLIDPVTHQDYSVAAMNQEQPGAQTAAPAQQPAAPKVRVYNPATGMLE
jgi:hypothetical protein